MPLTPGSGFGPYAIVAPLGTGGMGDVFRAHDPRLGRDVALKVMRATGPDGAALDRLLAEATLASSLNHPNIVTIYETGLIEPRRYLAMELVQGLTLRELAKQGVTIDRALEIVRQAAEALAVAHAAQVVHRDVKPENIMVRPDRYVKVLDFGLARLERVVSSSPTMPATGAGLIVGTIAYMAPEQARGESATAAADVFALGLVMYELLAGRRRSRQGGSTRICRARSSSSSSKPSTRIRGCGRAPNRSCSASPLPGTPPRRRRSRPSRSPRAVWSSRRRTWWAATPS